MLMLMFMQCRARKLILSPCFTKSNICTHARSQTTAPICTSQTSNAEKRTIATIIENSKLPLSMKAKPPSSQAHCSQQETYVYSQAGGSLLRNSQRLGRSLEALDADMLPAPALLNLFSIPARRRLELHLLQLANHLLYLAILD